MGKAQRLCTIFGKIVRNDQVEKIIFVDTKLHYVSTMYLKTFKCPQRFESQNATSSP